MRYELAPDIKELVEDIVVTLDMDIPVERIVCMRSYGSKANAYARVWAMPKIWQKALGMKPRYIIEVLSEKFDDLSRWRKVEILIHELLHIPKSFGGGLLDHKRYANTRNVSQLYREYMKRKQELKRKKV